MRINFEKVLHGRGAPSRRGVASRARSIDPVPFPHSGEVVPE